MENIKKVWVALVVIGIIAISALGIAMYKQTIIGAAGDINTTVVKFVKGLKAGQTNQVSIDQNGVVALGATTTIARSPDGFVIWGSFSLATGTAKALYTNNDSPLACDSRSAIIAIRNTTGFVPSLVFSMGSSTASSGVGATNIIASTTMATTTAAAGGSFAIGAGSTLAPFILGNEESIVGNMADITNISASSTYYSRMTAEFGIHCWSLGQ